jgi:hypothetical protein
MILIINKLLLNLNLNQAKQSELHLRYELHTILDHYL